MGQRRLQAAEEGWGPPFPEEEYRQRVDKVVHEMACRGIDLLFVSSPPNITYLTGYDLVFCGVYHRYHTDLGRLFSVGEPDPRWRDLMRKATGSVDHVVSAVKLGDPVTAAQWAADDYIDSVGLSKYAGFIGGYDLGISIPPDWVGHTWLNSDSGFEQADYHSFRTAFNAGDIDALIALYEPTGILITQPGHGSAGIKPLREALGELLAMKPDLTAEPGELLVAGDIALSAAKWSQTGTGPNGEPIQQQGTTRTCCTNRPLAAGLSQ